MAVRPAEAPPAGRSAADKVVGRKTAVFAGWTAVSRVAGLVRESVAAALFGTSGPIAAFVIAFQVPNLLRSLVADSALSAAFIPVYTELREQGREREAQRLAGALFGLIAVGLGLVSLVAVVTAPLVMPIFATGLPQNLIDDQVGLSQVLFPIVALLGLTGLVVGILQANGEFAATAFAPVLWNIVILAALICVAPFIPGDERIYVYAGGILAGTLAQLLYLLPGLRGKGPFPLSLRLRDPHVIRVIILMLPVTVGLGLINVNAVVDTLVAQLVSEDSVRAIDAAFRLYILPQGIFSVAVATVLFPSIARQVAQGDMPGMRHTVGDGLRQDFFLLLPASAFLMVLAEPVTRLIYQHGQFNALSTDLTSEALFYFTLGLVFNGASLLLIRSFFSLQRPWLPTAVALGAMVLNAGLDLLLYRPLGTGGIPLSTSIVSFLSFMALAWLLGREIGGLDVRWLLDGFVRMAVASAVLALLAWTTWKVLDEALGTSVPAQIVSVGLAAVTGTLGYAAWCRGLDVPELGKLARLMRPLR